MKFLSVLCALVLSACVTGGAKGPVSYEAVGDEGYRNYTLKWNGSGAGTQTDVYYRIHNDAGYLRICGFYVVSESGSADLMSRAWLNDAYFELHNEKVLSTRYLNPQPEFYDSKAACVTTTTKHKKFVAIAFKIKGNNVKVFF